MTNDTQDLATKTQPEVANYAAPLIYPKVVVLCRNSDGEPEFHTCTPGVTHAQKIEGKHYEMAMENAADQGYDEPMVAFDKTDAAAKQLAEVWTWLD